MLKFVVILSLIYLSDAKLIQNRIMLILKKFESSGDLWVLDMNSDLSSINLRPGSIREEIVFDEVIGPVKGVLDQQLENSMESGEVEEYSMGTELSTQELKYEILKSINKFDIASRTSSDSLVEMSDLDEDVISLALYMKHHKTLLAVKYGADKLFYFIISLPWRLPEWFHEDHKTIDNATSVQIPEDVKIDLYKSLERILKSYLPPTSTDMNCMKRLVKSKLQIICWKNTL